MPAQSRGGGCGCCGCLLGSVLVLLIALVIGVGFFYFAGTSGVDRLAVRGPFPSPATQFNRDTYISGRQKFDHFFSVAAERTLTLSNAEVDALLADSPELRVLGRGALVFLSQNAAEVYCSLPIGVPLLPKRYLNFSFEVRPSIRGDDVELDVTRIERDGRALNATETRKIQTGVVPLVETLLSNLNKFYGSEPVHEVRVENGNLILAR
ncbi:MAG TPA: hypothetical protein VJX28_02570 [Chthoniobacterales bacterium]|nr:hypothetical protein [Chthoniobacterales bacterium]